jgi:hypothetical protein
MFWRKKSVEPVDKADYLTFYIENDELRVEFGFDSIENLTRISDAILNGKVRNSSFSVIESKIREGGLIAEADYFVKSVNKVIKPSEYAR